MTEPRVTYATLRRFLSDLGFSEKVVPDVHVVFSQPASETEIMLPIYKDREIVHPRHVASVRVMLEAKELMSYDEFDRRLNEDSVRQSAS